MNLLSLFNGISGGMLACERAGIKIENHYACEIDKHANYVTMKNYPDTIMLGDVNDWQKWIKKLPKIHIMIWGSPCQDLSIAGKTKQGIYGSRSGLFWQAMNIFFKVKPKYFIMENVYSMPKECKELISFQLGVSPILINSSLVSGQSRKRLYWTNLTVTQPENKNIYLRDILESGISDKDKAYCLDASYYKSASLEIYLKKSIRQLVYEKPKQMGYIGKNRSAERIYCITGKAVCLKSTTGGQGSRTGLYIVDLPDGEYYVRKLTPTEAERLQTYPDGWTAGISNTQRYKCLGNSFTVDVIAHILKGVKNVVHKRSGRKAANFK